MMVHRVESYIRNEWDHMIIDPDDCLSRNPKCDYVEPAIGPGAMSWENLTSAFCCPKIVPSFSNGQMIQSVLLPELSVMDYHVIETVAFLSEREEC